MAISLASIFRRVWGHPLARKIDVDDTGTVEVHRAILRSKVLLRSVYRDWYRECLPASRATEHLSGLRLELGCGVGFMEELFPDIIRTDVFHSPDIDVVLDASELPFRDGQLRTIFLISVVHHLRSPSGFLEEAQRCLEPGGRLVMVEPSNSSLTRFLCETLNHYEFLDDAVGDWDAPEAQRLSSANLAIPWVVFVRDENQFHQRFPSLRIVGIRYHTFLAYWLSGGMSFRAFLPSFCLPLVKLVEFAAGPMMKCLGTCMTIDIRKV